MDQGSIRPKPSQYVTASGVFLLHVRQPVGLRHEIHVGNLFPVVVLVAYIGHFQLRVLEDLVLDRQVPLPGVGHLV